MKKYLYVLLCTLLVCCSYCSSQAQLIINTIAGTGTSGYSGDGGLATAAQFFNILFVSTDGSGNVYVTDQGNHCIRKVNTAGIISTFAGDGTVGYSGDGGPAGSAKLNHPTGIAADGAGNFYILDNGYAVIRKVNTSGIISTFAGTLGIGFSGDGGPATNAKFNYPMGMRIDGSGNIYIADGGNNRIRKINSAGIITTVAGNGAGTYGGDGGPATAASIGTPWDVAVDISGNLYIAEYNGHRIRKINTSGIITTVAGTGAVGYSGDGGPATAAQISYPTSLAVDIYGNIFISDNYSRIRKVDVSGIITTAAGTGVGGFTGDGCSATAAQINHLGVITDAIGNIYITCSNHVRKIHPDNFPSFIGGSIQNTSVCMDSVLNLNTILTVSDFDNIQSETWSVIMPPTHGALVASYSTTSTGGLLVPPGLSYTPIAGYSGNDSFKVTVTDCVGAADTTTVYVAVQIFPVTGDISPADSVCAGDTVSFSGASLGGTWSSSNTAVATISSSGIAMGVLPGTCTITYTISNSCGTATATFPFVVRPFSACVNDVSGGINKKTETLTIYPNPTKGGQFTAYISSSAEEWAQLSITNLLGQKVMELPVKTNTGISLKADLPPGIYILTATTRYKTFTVKLQH